MNLWFSLPSLFTVPLPRQNNYPPSHLTHQQCPGTTQRNYFGERSQMRRKHPTYTIFVIDRHCCLKLDNVEEDHDHTTVHLRWKCDFYIQSNVIYVAFLIIYHNLRRISFFVHTDSNLHKPLIWTLKLCAPKVDKTMSKLLSQTSIIIRSM